MRIYILILSCSLIACLNAQVISDLGRFSIEYDRGCTPTTVHITRLDTFGNVSRQYFYQSDIIERLDTFYTYNNPGRYNIVQFIGEDVIPKTDTLSFEILESPLPVFDIFKCSSTSFQLNIENEHYDNYDVIFNNSTYNITPPDELFLNLNQSPSTLSVKGNYDTAFNEGCPINSEQISNFSSFEIIQVDSIRLEESCLGTFDLYIQGQFDDNAKYSISIRLDDEITGQTVYEGAIQDRLQLNIPLSNNEFEAFCMDIQTLNPCSNSRVNNIIVCAEPQTHRNDIDQIYASYSGKNIFLNLPSVSGVYLVSRAANFGNFVFLDSLNEAFLDENIFGNRQYEYRVIKLDSCDNEVWSYNVSPPFQKIISKELNDNTVIIEQTAPTLTLPFISSNYIQYNMDSTSTALTPLSSELNLMATLGNRQAFRASYTLDNNVNIFSNELIANYKFLVYAPSAFSPNNDGLNDIFEFFGLPEAEGVLLIFDRWGKNIFRSSQPELGWDGFTAKGIAPEGTYRYKIQFTIEGKILEQVGSFALITN